MSPVRAGSGKHDFAFQSGLWDVRHSKLKGRLVDSAEWIEFDGRCRAWELLGGDGSVDDHFLDDPAGSYAAATFRRLDLSTGNWSIWWFDPRFPVVDAPVVGCFEDGVGTFFADDTLNGDPIRVRFIWSAISMVSARWEQAFSGDGGRTWEVNWIMQFKRVA